MEKHVNKRELTANEKKVILALQGEKKGVNMKAITKKALLKEDAAMQAAFLLKERGLCEIKETKNIFYSLTKEGEVYAEKGLPEKQLLKFFEKKAKARVLIHVFKDEFPYMMEKEEDFPVFATIGNKKIPIENIAINWAKEKGWIEIERKDEKKFLKLTGKRSYLPFQIEGDIYLGIDIDEEIFRIIKKSGEIEEEALRKRISERSPEINYKRYYGVVSGILRNLTRRNLLKFDYGVEREIKITELGEKILSDGISIEEEITQLTPELIRTGSWKRHKFKKYDFRLRSKEVFPAKKHPYQRILQRIRRIFTEMGFVEIKDEFIQNAFWNFDALFVPQDHPAREIQDTFYLGLKKPIAAKEGVIERVKEMHEHGGSIRSKGWRGIWHRSSAEELLLRTHTTTVTIKYLESHPEPPVKIFCIDRVYRRETPDATHIPELYQLEGIAMDKGLSLKNLFGYLSTFYKKIGFPSVRFRPGYFPYTEPSVEVEVYTNEFGWIELGGAGILREEVTNPIGVKDTVLAWGLGIGRLAMLILRLKDIRHLYQSDIKWLRETPVFI